MDTSATRIQSLVRGCLVRQRLLIPSAEFQTKNWRKSRNWFDNGKRNECELYQRRVVEKITKMPCGKSNIRINITTKEMLDKKYPMKDVDGFEWTEDFDGFIAKSGLDLYFNFKMICDAGGAQTRTLREVYHFVCVQMEYLLAHHSPHVYFINILDGDTSFRSMDKFGYLLNQPQYSRVREQVFVGDMKQFQLFWKKI